MNVLRTIIIPASHAGKGRQLGTEIDVHGHGMFVTGLSPNGLAPATHYVSSGQIEQGFAAVLNDGLLLHAAAQAGAARQGIAKVATEPDAVGLVGNAIVHDGFDPADAEGVRSHETPHQLFARLGLKIVSEAVV